MMNILRADIYRMVRSKSLYITCALLFAYILLIVGTMQAINIGGNMFLEDSSDLLFDGANIIVTLASRMDTLIYFLLPLSLLVSSPMFTNNTIKNDIAWGISRSKLYFSKILLSSILCVFMLLFYVVVGMLIATVLHGFGAAISTDMWINLIQMLSSQLFMLLVMNSIIISLMFTTKRTIVVTGAYIGFSLVPMVVLSILLESNPTLITLLNFDIPITIRRFANINLMDSSEVIKLFTVGVSYMLIATTIGLLSFRKADIQ